MRSYKIDRKFRRVTAKRSKLHEYRSLHATIRSSDKSLALARTIAGARGYDKVNSEIKKLAAARAE